MKRGPVLYAAVFGLFIAGILVALNRPGKTGSIFLIGAGIVSILFARSLAEVQNQINEATKWFTWNAWGKVRPFLFVAWETGVVAVGVAWLFGW